MAEKNKRGSGVTSKDSRNDFVERAAASYAITLDACRVDASRKEDFLAAFKDGVLTAYRSLEAEGVIVLEAPKPARTRKVVG